MYPFGDVKPNHELVAISFLMNLLINDDAYTKKLCESFITFLIKYKNYRFHWRCYDARQMVIDELSMYCEELQALISGFPYSRTHSYNDIINFGEMVTEFLIRVVGVDFVGISNQKNVLTSNSHLNNTAIETIDDQYKIFKMKKAIYIPSQLLYELGRYEFATPLPYAPDYCECYLETELDHFERVLSKK